MALERWDYRERKKSRFLVPLLFVFSFILTVAVFYWCDSFKVSSGSLSAVSAPVSVERPSYSPSFSVPSDPVLVKQSPVVRSVPSGYQGYIEVNGVKKEIYSSAVTSETYRYKSVSNVKFIPIKINGIEFDAMIDTGASEVSLNFDAVRRLGVTQFTDKKVHDTAAGSVWAYYFPCSITLGSFEVLNIQCSYNPENVGENLLGGSFLKNFNYSFNESENTITLSLR